MELGLEKLPWYGQIATFLAVAVAGFVVFQMYWAQPTGLENETLQLQLNQLRLRAAALQSTADRLQEYQAEVSELEAQLDDLRAVFPDRRNTSRFLRRLQTLAAQTGLSVRAVTPQESEPQESYSAWPTRLELVGTYHELGLFLERVGAFSSVITISDVSIQALDPPESNATILVECTATTYALSEATDVSEPAV